MLFGLRRSGSGWTVDVGYGDPIYFDRFWDALRIALLHN